MLLPAVYVEFFLLFNFQFNHYNDQCIYGCNMESQFEFCPNFDLGKSKNQRKQLSDFLTFGLAVGYGYNPR